LGRLWAFTRKSEADGILGKKPDITAPSVTKGIGQDRDEKTIERCKRGGDSLDKWGRKQLTANGEGTHGVLHKNGSRLVQRKVGNLKKISGKRSLMVNGGGNLGDWFFSCALLLFVGTIMGSGEPLTHPILSD